MEIEEALRTYLLTKTALTTLVGTRIVADGIFGTTQTPCVVFFKVSDVKSHTHDGISDLENPVFQFSAYSDVKTTTRSIANAIRDALCDYTGTLSGVTVQYIKLLNEISSAQQSGDGSQTFYIDDLEFEIFFVRS